MPPVFLSITMGMVTPISLICGKPDFHRSASFECEDSGRFPEPRATEMGTGRTAGWSLSAAVFSLDPPPHFFTMDSNR